MARLIALSLGLAALLAPEIAYAPPVVAAVAVYGAYNLALIYTTSALVASIVAIGVSAVITNITKPGRQQGLPNFQAEAKDRQTVIRSSVEPRRIVYGRAAVSGPLAYAESTGSSNEFIHLIIPLAGHEVDAIGEVYLNDEVVPLDTNGLGLGRWAKFQTSVSKQHSASKPTSPYTITVPDTVVAVQQVRASYNLGFITFTDSGGATPDSLFSYSRSGSVFTFNGHFIEKFGASITGFIIDYYDGTASAGSYVRVKKHLGATDQTADSDLVSESAGGWTTDHRLRGIAYLYVRLEFNLDVFPTGVPNIKAVVRGKKLYDPRGGSPSLVQWSDNWALVVRDYLTSSYGLACDDDEIDDDLIIAAANIADENVDLDIGSPSTTQKRYTANGSVNLADRPVDILRQLVSAGAGQAVFSEGVWKVFAGAYTTPEIDIDEDWLRGPIKVRAKPPRRELFNGVRGVFSNADRFWQPTDFPPVTNSTYATQDGEEILRDLELPFTTESVRAQRIAKIHLESGRQGIVAELPCNMKAFQVAAWDTVRLSIERLGWESKVFRVIAWKFSQEGGIDLVVKEEASAVYDWAAGDETENDPAPDTELQSAVTASPPTDVTISLTQDSNRLLVSWTAPDDPFVVAYQVEYITLSDLSSSPSLDWAVLPRTNGTNLDLGNLLPDQYRIRVKSINTLGISSEYETVSHVLSTGASVDTYPMIMSILTNTWTEVTLTSPPPGIVSLADICWSGTNFVAVGTAPFGSPSLDSYIITSPDGLTWTERANPSFQSLTSVISAELGSPSATRLVAVGATSSGGAGGGDAIILTSDDHGVTWTERASTRNTALNAVTWSGSLFVAVGSLFGSTNSYCVTSPDGITWTERVIQYPGSPTAQAGDLMDVAWSDDLGLFCAVGLMPFGSPTVTKGIFTSPDGITWTDRTHPKGSDLYTITWAKDDSLFIALGNTDGTDAYIITSPDGINWTERSNPKSVNIQGAADWNGSIVVAVGAFETTQDVYLITSSDGINWVERPTPITASQGLFGIAWNGKVFVAVGSHTGTQPAIIRSLPVS
jgi:hypothetical protein